MAPVIDITKDLNALFTAQASATPSAAALEDKHSSYTYAELDARVDQLSHVLREAGVTRDSPVGILLERSADYVLACLAVLRAGGAFLVLELAYPAGLLREVIEDAKPTVIITSKAQLERVQGVSAPILIAGVPLSEFNGPKGLATSPPPASDDLDRLAFISYSSGTTGLPKGIANPHRASVLSYNLRFAVSDVGPGDRVACNVYFVWEMLRPLLRGGTVVAVPDEASYDPVALVQHLAEQNITETLMTSTLLAAVLSKHPSLGAKLPKLKTLFLNGEVVTTDLARRAIKALPNTRLLNCYSASETHEVATGDIRAMLATLEPDAACCPVGPPMDAAHTYIVAEDGTTRITNGEPGELYVGGDLLARGYINLPETTAKAFLKDTFSPQDAGARMYKTGDMARIIPGSGLLEITGRVGGMIRIRGYSIVPARVEKTIIDHLAISNAAVVGYGEGIARQLIAYVVLEKDEQRGRTPVTVDEHGYSPASRHVLEKFLPHYMLPTLWIELDALPTHGVSGKVDLKNMPDPMQALAAVNVSRSRARTPPPDEMVNPKSIARMWAVSLSVSPETVLEASRDATFFDLGGHSLALADLATRISKTMGGFTVNVGDLAGSPTLDGHVRVVLESRDGHIAKLQADLPAILRKDSTLDADVRPAQGIKPCRLSEAETILLTGATGFLGGNLLHDLLENTTARIICLIRFNTPYRTDRSAAMARLRTNMLELGLWHESMLDRVDVIPSNLSRHRLGLLPEVYEELAASVQVVVHCAAQVNLVYPYAALRDPNVKGTLEVIKLACQANATLQYVSTNGVLPPSQTGWSEEDSTALEDVQTKLLDGYCQTKWVAEQLALEAGRRGLPVHIYRVGTLSGHSETGSTNTYDLLTALIVESLILGVAPEADGWHAEMTPVDFVSRAIVALSDHPDYEQQIYHVGDASPIDCKKLFDNMEQLGYRTERKEWDQWVELWNEKRGGAKGGEHGFTVDILRSGMPSKDTLFEITALQDAKTKAALGGLRRPNIDAHLFGIYARHWYARGWIHQQPKRLQNGVAAVGKASSAKGPLAGKVAVITGEYRASAEDWTRAEPVCAGAGASSGIGAAVATALAREGAHVSLAARRLDALEGLKSKLVASSPSSKVHLHKTDVTDRKQVEELFATTAEALGPVDIIVSCAGVMYWTLMKNVVTHEWDQTVDVNCKGLLNVLSSSLQGMLSRGAGHIVAISSDAGRKVFPGLGVYSASKFFVEATLQSLRLETAGTGLRVTSIQPGNTATDLLTMSSDKEAIEKYGQPSGAKILSPTDIANAIVYALSQPAHVSVNEVLVEPRDEPI